MKARLLQQTQSPHHLVGFLLLFPNNQHTQKERGGPAIAVKQHLPANFFTGLFYFHHTFFFTWQGEPRKHTFLVVVYIKF